MAIFQEERLLAKIFLNKRSRGKSFLIGIDGKDGSGKSTLSKELSSILSAKVIELDSFMVKHQNKYVSALRLDEIKNEIIQSKGIVIIEGVCLLAVMKELSVELDEHVYVKRICRGKWSDKDTCDIDGSVDEIIKKEEAGIHIVMEWMAANDEEPLPTKDDAKISTLTEEIIRYHAKFNPHKKANHIFEIKHA